MSHERQLRNFYKNFEFYMKIKGNTRELEAMLNVSAGYISRIKNGKKKMSIEMAMDVAEYFDTTLIHMLESEDWVDLEIKELEGRLVELKKKKEAIE